VRFDRLRQNRDRAGDGTDRRARQVIRALGPIAGGNRRTTVIRKSLPATAAAAVAAAGAIVAPQTAVAATTAPVSTIYSAALNTCLDTSTTDPSHYFLDTYGHPCDGAVSQDFAFHAQSSGPAGTYEITSQATGQCIVKYRQALRQAACTGTVPPDSSSNEWTLQPVGTTGHDYRFVLTSTVGSAYPACIQVNPAPGGYPGPLFNTTYCSTNSAQVLTLSTTP
jgi:hypothetical protein